MATGLAAAIAQAMLNALCRNVKPGHNLQGSFSNCIQLIQEPRAPTAAFGDATRQSAHFSAAAGDGTITNSADVNWASVTAAGTVTHVSFWSASSGGTFLGSDDLAAPRTLAVGDNFTVWLVTLI